MTEKSPRITGNRLIAAGTVVTLAFFAFAKESSPHDISNTPERPLPNTNYVISKNCAAHPDAYQKFSLTDMQHLYVQAGLRNGTLLQKDIVTISGTAQELTVTPAGAEGRTVFPDKVEQNTVETFPFDTLGTVAIGRLQGEAHPSVVLACNITELADAHQPFVGQLVQEMPPQQ